MVTHAQRVFSSLLVVCVTLGLGAVLAQEAPKPPEPKPAPVLSEMERLTVSLLEAKLDAASLRVALAQTQLELQRREAETYFVSLRKDGFTLQRGEDGRWSYLPVTPPPR